MADLFRSAFSYFSQMPPSSGQLLGKTDHPLVGSSVEVGNYRLKIRTLIAEGGYALVFSAQDSQGNWYALKRQLAADKDATNAILQEIEFLRSLSGHPSILRFVQAAQLASRENSRATTEYLLLTELCSGGNVVELLQKGPLTISQVLKIFNAACQAVQHMHSKVPPITHRDIKVENLLFDSTGHVKLCDFGSATTDVLRPDETWNAARRTELEENLARFTTPMYRAPEVLDVYSNYVVGPPQDIWALGCILYYLCYREHPFKDSAKLRIINAKYSLPQTNTGYNIFHSIIKECLQIDPSNRLSINALCKQTKLLAATCHIDLDASVEGVELSSLSDTASDICAGSGDRMEQQWQSGRGPPPRPPPLAAHRMGPDRQEPTPQQQASAVFGALKGQGMSWFKNIKDKTAAVAQTVQSTYGGRGPDVTFVTSRLVLAPLSDAIPDALAAQAEEAMRAFILQHSEGQFAIYNLSQRRLRCNYSDRLSEIPLPPQNTGVTPTLKHIFGICRNMTLYLQQCATNFVVITGPEAQCCLLVTVMLMYGRLFEKSLAALQFLESRRTLPILPASYHRLLDLVSTIVSSSPQEIRLLIHNRQTSLNSLLMCPPPKFNIARNGCRPIVDVYTGGNKLWSSRKSYEMLRAFELPGCSTAEIDLENVLVAGEVQIVVYHGRWSKVHGRMQEYFMFSLGFHSNFIDPNTHILEMSRKDLDIHQDDEQKFDDRFRVGVRLHIEDKDREFNESELPSFLHYDADDIVQFALVSSREEFDRIAQPYELSVSNSHGASLSEKSLVRENDVLASASLFQEDAPITHSGKDADFFSTLSWDEDVKRSTEPVRSAMQSILPCADVQQKNKNESLTKRRDVAEEYERLYGIRVGGDDVEDPDAELYKFDCEKRNKNESSLQTEPSSETQLDAVDLLGIGDDSVKLLSNESNVPSGSAGGFSANFKENLNGLIFLNDASTKSFEPTVDGTSRDTADDLLSWSTSRPTRDLLDHVSTMHRNVSAPVFVSAPQTKPVFDPFADFLAAHPDPVPTSSSKPTRNGSSGPNSGRATPNVSRPNYSRSHFDALNSIGGAKVKLSDNTFDDLLSTQGFTSSRSQKSMSELRKEEENRELDPVAIKMRDWVAGKERNIRALLGSLNDVLWPGADKWVQPSMAQLLTPNQVKKYYRKACLVIHPDKQAGTENEDIARAIFTELNDAWSAFEAAGSPAL